MSLNNFILGKILGKGSYGSVRIVERKEDHKIYALKSVVINVLGEKEKLNSFNEVRLLASLKHQNIIDYKESFFDEKEKTLNIVMEYADDGDLRTKITQILKNNLSFEESTIWNVLIQILEGLNYLHKNNIIHRDLKSANIFLTKNGLIKIGDLNVSTIAKKGVANTQTGTPYYASPEIWNDKPYNSKCDIWSLGCIIYEMSTLHVPFRGTSLNQLYCRIMKGKYSQIPSRYSNDLKNIIKIILNEDVQKRPSAEELLKNEIIIKKMKEYGINKNSGNKISEKAILIKTIKIPKNISQINKQLPQKRYELKQSQNKEEMFNNDEYEYSKNNFYKLSKQEQNKIIKNSLIQYNESNKENIVNAKEPIINNININDIIITTSDTDRNHNNEKNKNEIIEILNKEQKINDNKNHINNIELENLIVKSDKEKDKIIKDNFEEIAKQNIENIYLMKQGKMKKPYKDTGYHFFKGNKDNNNDGINQFLINKKPEKPNEQKQRRNTGPSKKPSSVNNKKLPNIRPKSTKNIIEKNRIKDYNSNQNNIKNCLEIKNNLINKNKKEIRKISCASANKKNNKNIYNNFSKEKVVDKRKINGKNKKDNYFNKENNDKQNLFQINHRKSQPKQKERSVSIKCYNKINIHNESKLPNINNEKNYSDKKKFKIYYNQYFNEKKMNKNNDKNNNDSSKHKIIYEKIEIIKNGKKNKYSRGNAEVKYIEVGNHYRQYKKLKNNNNYIIFECGKRLGPKMILPNKW